METKIIPPTPGQPIIQIELTIEELGDIVDVLGDTNRGKYSIYNNLLGAWREAVNDEFAWPTLMGGE